MPRPRGRFAPSPSGRMHLGNARTALLAWLQMRALGGEIILRIEDLDPARSKPEFEAGILEDLRWLGLDWDAGPDVGGPDGPYRQSERGDFYTEALGRLATFHCVCTRRELREATSAPEGVEPIYPGTCRDREMAKGAVRWRIPAGQVRAVDGCMAEPLEQDMRRDVGEMVLRRADGAWAYQLAVVVDDAAMGITHVLRGADLWTSTPRQIHLQQALDLPHPEYTHVGLVVDASGQKLAKRARPPTLARLRDAGVPASRVLAWLAASMDLRGRGKIIHPRDLVESFEPMSLRPTATVYDDILALPL